ncbi:MAG: DUF362 domain-containing protein [Candidatus Levybacteria bacterium]|nr:DUF362 domain-containing protein [Candidatus Levybacteria bacterium]
MNADVYIYKSKSRDINLHTVLKHMHEQIFTKVQKFPYIVVKPNFLSVRRQISSTHPKTLELLIKYLRRSYQGQIIIAEGSRVMQDAYTVFHLPKLEKKYNIRIVNTNSDDTTWSQFKGIDQLGRIISIRYSDIVKNGYRISLSVPKMHANAGVTFSLKNMMGAIHPKDRRLMHGLSEVISKDTMDILKSPWWEKDTFFGELMSKVRRNFLLYFGGRLFLTQKELQVLMQNYHVLTYNLYKLSTVLYPHLSIIDAFEAMQDEGPWFGSPVTFEAIIASCNFKAADVSSAHMMGVQPSEMEFLYYLLQSTPTLPEKIRYPLLHIDAISQICKPHSNFSYQQFWKQDKQFKKIYKLFLTEIQKKNR